jgi:hypothetical protein
MSDTSFLSIAVSELLQPQSSQKFRAVIDIACMRHGSHATLPILLWGEDNA